MPRFLLFSVLLFLAACAIPGTESYREQQRAELKPLAMEGDLEAQYALGMSYERKGSGRDYNNEKALNWLCTAGRHGQKNAEFELGKIYEEDNLDDHYRGFNVKHSNITAFAWYHAASAGGSEDATTRMAELNQNITEVERQHALELLQDRKTIPCSWGN